MPNAIVFVNATPNPMLREPEQGALWKRDVNELCNITENAKGVERLSESAWLIPLESGLPVLSRLVLYSEEHSLECRTLLLVEEPIWLA